MKTTSFMAGSVQGTDKQIKKANIIGNIVAATVIVGYIAYYLIYVL